MLSVENKPIMLSVIMLSVIMPSVIMLDVVASFYQCEQRENCQGPYSQNFIFFVTYK
jgi:hypothetical protein